MVGYDTFGGRSETSDPNGNVTSFTFNSVGQVTQILDPVKQKTTFTYDSSGNLIQVTDALGNDTVHMFTAQDGPSGCNFYETRTQTYQGTGSARQLLKQVDTSYAHAFVSVDDSLTGLNLGNVGRAGFRPLYIRAAR